jgi:hypothetical protein
MSSLNVTPTRTLGRRLAGTRQYELLAGLVRTVDYIESSAVRSD